MKNTNSKKHCKNIVIKTPDSDEEEDPHKKLNEKFNEKCYFYGLPENWSTEYLHLNVDNRKKTKLSNIYNTLKQQLANKAITICDILKVTSVTHNERLEMLEDYAIMQSYDGDIKEYVHLRSDLRKKIEFYNERTIAYEDVVAISNKKQRLAKMNLGNSEMESKILSLNVNEFTQAIIYQKYLKLGNMAATDSEYHKLKEWIQTVISIPYSISKPLINNTHGNVLQNIKRKLDEEIYGMNNVKEEILLFLKQRLENPESTNISLALAGPPGVGKTKIIRTLSKILDLPFEQIPMGGVNDVSFLDGNLYVYEGSKPGIIVNTLIKFGCNNGILFFDEIDKTDSDGKGKDVSRKLLHITDFTQNTNYTDKYLPEINIDLSKIWYMFALNDANNLNHILRDRMYIVNVPGYSNKDKICMLKQYIIPQLITRLNIDSTTIIIPDKTLQYIVNRCKKEEGIRELQRVIELIFRKFDVLCALNNSDDIVNDIKLSFNIKDFKLPHTLCDSDVNIFLNNYDEGPKLPPGLYC